MPKPKKKPASDSSASEVVSQKDAAYTPTKREQAGLDAVRERSKLRPFAPKLVVKESKDAPQLRFDHEDQFVASRLLMQAIGTADTDFLSGLLMQVANAGSQGPRVEELGVNFMLSVVKSIEPRDEMEVMLASQMAAVHMATMTFARRLAHVENIPQQDAAERAFNKLARTFATQLEALKRYRTGGQQKMTVEHVHVHEGGQAIVGNVATSPTGGRQTKKDESTP